MKMILEFDNLLDYGFAILISYWIIKIVKKILKP